MYIRKINGDLLRLTNDHDLSANDVSDVIAEQVTAAKESSNERVSDVAKRLERKFGSRIQEREESANYNAKADEFGGYFLSFVLNISSRDNLDGIAIGLEALENAYEIQNSIVSTANDNHLKEYVDWYERLVTVLSNEIQDEMYESGWAMTDAVDLMNRILDSDSLLNAVEKYQVAVKKGAFIETRF